MKFYRKLLFLFLGGILIAGHLNAQVNISGRVVDKESQKPIPDVHVLEDVNFGAEITDSLGRFSIEVERLPVLISVSHLSFHPQALLVDRAPSGGLKIELVSKNVQISEVVVVAERLQQFFRREVFYVREMEFSKGLIWVIGNPENSTLKKELRILSLDARTLEKLELRKPAGLYKDAFGEIYLDNDDSLNQLYWDGKKLILDRAFIKNGDEEFLYALQTSYDSLAILKLVSGNGKLNEFMAFNFRDSSRHTFHYSFDHELFASSQMAERHKFGNIPDIIFPPFGVSFRFDPSDGFTSYAQDRLLTYTPVNSKLFKIDEELLIFEDKGPFLWKYNLQLQPDGMVSIKVPEKSNHIEIQQDPVTNLLYVIYTQQGRHYVASLDPGTGELMKTIRIQDFTFIENLRIYGNRVYYLDQSRIGKKTMNLYSLKLD